MLAELDQQLLLRGDLLHHPQLLLVLVKLLFGSDDAVELVLEIVGFWELTFLVFFISDFLGRYGVLDDLFEVLVGDLVDVFLLHARDGQFPLERMLREVAHRDPDIINVEAVIPLLQAREIAALGDDPLGGQVLGVLA